MTKDERFLFCRAKARLRSRRNSECIDPATGKPETQELKQENYQHEILIVRELIKDKHYSAPILSR